MSNLTNPISITTAKTFSKYQIIDVSVELNKSASIKVLLCDTDMTVSDTIYVYMDGTDYANWGSDDSYIDTFVKNKLNEMYPSST